MNFPQLSIRTTKGMLGLNITDSQQLIRQPKADLQIRQPRATVDMETSNSILKIDSSQARRDLGLIGPLESTRKYAQRGRQAMLAGIARRAQEGDQLMRIEKKGNPIQSIAETKAVRPMKRLGLQFVPSISSVKISYTPSKLHIEAETNKPQISAKMNRPIHEYTPGKVSGYMIQDPSIEIDVIV
ncbi:DUF6470 family protein [Chungangia koreensis]|uniref:DUF6470 family protein n=1 Tax=Chungangia koreensis TaxID=752657 RepID=A0ABV8X5N9_9LACT